MSFDRPEGLWLLALAIPILAFHFYRGRIRRMQVPTLALWEQVLVEEERKSALRRLRHYASLLLNLFALAVLTSAVSEPRVSPPKRLAIVVDTSPSMLANRRLEDARERAGRWLDSADEAALYDGSGLREPLTRDLRRVRDSLGTIAAKPGSRAAEIAAMLRKSRPDLEVVLLTATESLPNRGWTSATWVQAPDAKFPTLVARIEHFGTAPREEKVVVRWNGDVLAERTGTRDFELPLDPSKFPGRKLELGGAVEVEFAEPDAQTLDDAAYVVVPSSLPVPVIVFHPGKPDPFLMAPLRALAAEGRVGEILPVAIDHFAQARAAITESTAVIFDRCEERLSSGVVLRFGAEGDAVERPVVTDWDRTSPLLEGSDLTDLAVRRSRIVRGGTPLIESASGPIASWSRRGGYAEVRFGFTLDESDFALRAAYPIFMRQWIEWARRGATRAFPASAAFGRPLVAEVPWIREGAYRVRDARGEASLTPDWPGIYRISAEGRDEFVAVNSFDRASSDLSVASPGAPVPPPRPWHRRVPYAVLAAAVVLALLFLEWFLYHRGWI